MKDHMSEESLTYGLFVYDERYKKEVDKIMSFFYTNCITRCDTVDTVKEGSSFVSD